jgi:hypothetical protein
MPPPPPRLGRVLRRVVVDVLEATRAAQHGLIVELALSVPAR